MTILRPLDDARLRTGLAELARLDPDVAREIERIGPPAARVRPPGFATLLNIVTAQQVSTHAARAIFARLEGRLGAVTPEALLAVGEDQLRACGLSARKVAYARGLAEAVATGTLDLDALSHAPDEAVVEAITALKGFGRWSADIYLLFALGRADAWPMGDLAVRLALMRLKGWPDRPDDAAMARQGEAWRPWRGCGAIFLWHYYGAATLDR
jgi:DNA-3-methyladenine glycosylase II